MHRVTASLLLVLLFLPEARPAFAVQRTVIRQLQGDYAGHTYQLRTDLRSTNYLARPNVVDGRGFRFQGRDFPVLFRHMETVYLDRIANEGKKTVVLTVYRNRREAKQIRGSVPAAPLPVGPDRTTTLGNFARDLSTSVLLELSADKDDPAAQSREITELLNRVFYLKEAPTFEEKEAFVRSHPDLPIPKLVDLTGLSREVIEGILKRRAVSKEK